MKSGTPTLRKKIIRPQPAQKKCQPEVSDAASSVSNQSWPSDSSKTPNNRYCGKAKTPDPNRPSCSSASPYYTKHSLPMQTILSNIKKDLANLCGYENQVHRCPVAGVPTFEPCYLLSDLICQVAKLERQFKLGPKLEKQYLNELQVKLKKHMEIINLLRCIKNTLCKELFKGGFEVKGRENKFICVIQSLRCLEREFSKLTSAIQTEYSDIKKGRTRESLVLKDSISHNCPKSDTPAKSPEDKVETRSQSDSQPEKETDSSEVKQEEEKPEIIKQSGENKIEDKKNDSARFVPSLHEFNKYRSKFDTCTLPAQPNPKAKSIECYTLSEMIKNKDANEPNDFDNFNFDDDDVDNDDDDDDDDDDNERVNDTYDSKTAKSVSNGKVTCSRSFNVCQKRSKSFNVCQKVNPEDCMQEWFDNGTVEASINDTERWNRREVAASPEKRKFSEQGTQTDEGEFEVRSFSLRYSKSKVRVIIPGLEECLVDQTGLLDESKQESDRTFPTLLYKKRVGKGIAESKYHAEPDGSLRFRLSYETDGISGVDPYLVEESGDCPETFNDLPEKVTNMTKLWYESAKQICEKLLDSHDKRAKYHVGDDKCIKTGGSF